MRNQVEQNSLKSQVKYYNGNESLGITSMKQ